MTNILITSAGKRVDLIKEFKKNLKNKGRVIIIDASNLNAGKFFADKFYLSPRIDSPSYIKFLADVVKKEKIDLIFTAIDPEISFLVKHRELFTEMNCLALVSSPETTEIANDKTKTASFLNSIGILTPKVIIKPYKAATYPVFIKPINGSGSRHAYKANDPRELKAFLQIVPDPLVTEFIDGQEYTLDCLSDLTGNIINIIPRKRIEVANGIAIKSIVDMRKDIINDAEKILKLLNVIGPSTIQCISNKNGSYFTELNLRFGGGAMLGIKSGGNYIAKLIGMLRGKKYNFSNSSVKNRYAMTAYLEHVFETHD